MMMTALLLLALLRQDESVDSLIRKLGSENVQEREKAAEALKKRSESAIEALRKAESLAVEPAEKARLRRALEEVLGYSPLTAERVRALRVSGSAPRGKVSQTAAQLTKLTGIPIELDAPADVDPEVPAVDVRDASLETILDTLAREAAGMWIVNGRRLLLVLPGGVPLRLFDARDLTEGLADERRLPMEPGEQPVPDPDGEAQAPLTGEDLASLLRHEVFPKSWEEADGKSIQGQNGWVIARNTPEVLRAVEAAIEAYRRRFLVEVRIELEAFAVKEGARIEETGIDRLREEAAEGKTARRLASFERTARNHRRIAFQNVTRMGFLTRYGEENAPVIDLFSPGARVNVRASLSDDRNSVRAEVEAGWSRLVSVEKRKEAAGEVQNPVFSNHSTQATLGVPSGRFALIGRIGETRMVEGLPDIVIVGRFTTVPRR